MTRKIECKGGSIRVPDWLALKTAIRKAEGKQQEGGQESTPSSPEPVPKETQESAGEKILYSQSDAPKSTGLPENREPLLSYEEIERSLDKMLIDQPLSEKGKALKEKRLREEQESKEKTERLLKEKLAENEHLEQIMSSRVDQYIDAVAEICAGGRVNRTWHSKFEHGILKGEVLVRTEGYGAKELKSTTDEKYSPAVYRGLSWDIEGGIGWSQSKEISFTAETHSDGRRTLSIKPGDKKPIVLNLDGKNLEQELDEALKPVAADPKVCLVERRWTVYDSV